MPVTASSSWKGLPRRVWERCREADLMGLSASVAFYVMLGVFPGLAAVASLFGVLGDAGDMPGLIRGLARILPDDAMALIEDQVARQVGNGETQAGGAGLAGPLIGFGVLLWSANHGMRGLFRGLNRIYHQEETRSLAAFTAVTFAFTLGIIAFLAFSLLAVLLLPRIIEALGFGPDLTSLLLVARWIVLLLVVVLSLAVIYRFGPSRSRVSWRSAAIGSAAAAVLWIAVSAAFSWYVQVFGNFASLYGPLSAVAAFIMWIWLSMVAVLLGAVLDAAILEEG